jgi:hypothetical protein
VGVAVGADVLREGDELGDPDVVGEVGAEGEGQAGDAGVPLEGGHVRLEVDRGVVGVSEDLLDGHSSSINSQESGEIGPYG